MLDLIYGGGASGKSAYAEAVAVERYREVCERNPQGRLLYVATMYPYKWNTTEIDVETQAKIERHRAMRAEKGFETVECYRNLRTLAVLPGDVILIECMSNLLANEMYLPKQETGKTEMAYETGQETPGEKIVRDMREICEKADSVIVVSNDVFSDGGNPDYDESTKDYIRQLGGINRALAGLADRTVEVVCGIPVTI